MFRSLQLINQIVKKSRMASLFYRTYFYYDLGKAQLGKITNPLNEFSSIVVIMTFVFGVNLRENKSFLGIGILSFLILFILMGYFFKHSGLWDTEQIVNCEKNVVQNEVYHASIKINRSRKL